MMINKITEIAKEAGEILRSGFKQNFEIEYKTNLSNLVTEYDKKSEKLIIDFIRKEFPTHSVLAEESGNHYYDDEFLWIIDPLDGTTNFAHGLPIFSVSIGVMKKGELICGVVYDVMRDAIYSAEKNSGSFCNEKKLKVSDNDVLRNSVLVTGFPYNIAENPDKAFERFIEFVKKSRAVRRLGSAAIDLCYVAEGVFDGFWEVSLNAWDIAAGKLIVEEAGGIVTDFNGFPMNIFDKRLLASNGKIHQHMIKVLHEVEYFQ